MKKSKQLFQLNRWWFLSAAIAVLSSGCATPPEHAFNSDFGQELTTRPKYYIEDKGESRFLINVHQGTPSSGAERIMDVKIAASTIANAEGRRRGWEKWDLNYIHESNQGWMHVVIAEVTRKKYIKPALSQP